MDIEAALVELEAAIRRRRRWRGRRVFYQVLGYDLAPILAAAPDPAAVHARVRAMLERHGHAAEAPPLPSPSVDAAALCTSTIQAADAGAKKQRGTGPAEGV